MFRLVVFFIIIGIKSFSFFEDDINNLFQEKKIEEKNIVIEQEVRAVTYDPVLVKDSYSVRLIDFLYCELFRLDEKDKVKPHLIEEYSWKNKIELYCKLKDGIYFSNGDKMTAYDVKDSIEYLMKNVYLKGSFHSLKKIEVLNDREFIILLKYPDSWLERILSSPMSAIVKRVDGKIYGTGAYYIDIVDNNSFLLKKNEYFYNKDRLKFDKIILKGELNSYQRILNSMKTENYATYDLYNSDIEKAKSIGAVGDKAEIKKGIIYDTVSLIFGKREKYSLETRKAIESIIDRDITTVYPKELGEIEFSSGYFPMELSKVKKEFSVKEAKKILKKNGLYNRKIDIICLNTIHNREIAEKVVRNFKDIGLDVEIKLYSQNKFLYQIAKRDYDIAIFNITLNQNYLAMNLEKVIVGELANKELQNALLPFITLMKKEENSENCLKIFDKILSLVYEGRYFIPIEHQNTFILGNKDIIKYLK